MKSMRTTFRIFAAAVFAAIGILTSCQQQGLDTPDVDGLTGKELVPVTLKASFVLTKVSYTETSAKNLKPVWEADDKVIGFDENNNTYEFTVTDVDATSGAATLTGLAPANCTLHLVYLGSATPASIEETSLPYEFSYNGQTGNNIIPAVMLADGKVTFGIGDFHFSNAGAVIGIDAVKGVPQGTTVTKIMVSGENLSAATIALSGSALTLTATPKTADAISVEDLNLTVNDADGTLSSPVLIAVPAGAVIAKVSVPFTKEAETMKKPSATPQEGVDYVTIAGIKWAKWNLGANSETEYGWYFPFAGTEGYVRYLNTWQSAKSTSAVFAYSPSSAYTVVASDYVYVKDQTFASGYSFDWANTPYHVGNDNSTGWTKYVHSSRSSYWWPVGSTPDNNMTLDPEDDAASVSWGGSWRMPTYTEFDALTDNTTSEWIDNYNGTGINGRLHTSTVSGEEGHSIFFPALGYGEGTKFDLSGDYGFYWASSVWDREADKAYEFYIKREKAHSDVNFRCLGMAVRPILDIE